MPRVGDKFTLTLNVVDIGLHRPPGKEGDDHQKDQDQQKPEAHGDIEENLQVHHLSGTFEKADHDPALVRLLL